MKANELMIGDWVIGGSGSGKPFKIGIIDPNFLYWNEVQPIPLTPEILEKNGFRIVFDGELHTSYFQDIEHFLYTEIKVDKTGIYQKLSMCDCLGNKVVLVECKFVHQLQHALRLCGIDKNIVL